MLLPEFAKGTVVILRKMIKGFLAKGVPGAVAPLALLYCKWLGSMLTAVYKA